MSNLFDALIDARLLNVVAPDNPCDVCGNPARYYILDYYIHVCSEKCFENFAERMNQEINSFAIKKLKGIRLNGKD